MKKKKKKAKKTSYKLLLGIGFIIFLISIIFLGSKFTNEKVKAQKSQSLIHTKPLAKKSDKPPAILLENPEKEDLPKAEIKNVSSGYCLSVPVIFYHHIQPFSIASQKKQTGFNVDSGIFDNQMNYLKSGGYIPVTAKQLIDALRSHSGLPGKPVVITFDDGYRDIYDYAYPILKKYGFVFNVAVITGLVNGGDYLTWDQIREMKGNGGYLMDHTWSHYSVSKGSNDKIQYEIQTAKKQLEDNTGQEINVFVYPFGSFNSNAINILTNDGFSGAFTTSGGTYQCDLSIMTLHRTRIGNASLSLYGL